MDMPGRIVGVQNERFDVGRPAMRLPPYRATSAPR
jgi:hypothetical protein